MTKKMIINAVDAEEVRIAILNHGQLSDFDIETRGIEQNKGNIYKAIVTAVEPSLNAAFVDYGADKQGFLTANDVRPPAAAAADGAAEEPERHLTITQLLKPKQSILVQVTKDEVGSKGAVLTTYLSLAGRYVVLMPDSATQGVSRKIEDEETRRRMREAAAMLAVPENMGVIIRTAGQDRSKTDVNRDLKFLVRLWDNIQKEAARAKAPALIFKEQDVIIRAIRDHFASDIDEIVLDCDEAFDRAAEYMHMVMPRQRSVLTRYVERRPIFHHYRIEEQLESIFQPRVNLPSGGSLVIEPTEALVAIDVNSGKQKSGGHEETALQTNLEAAEEVGRQLRLRDLGGIVVIDFIDMAQRKNQQKVERALKEALKHDKARVNLSRISRNGTLEITRQRMRNAVQSTMFHRCAACKGTGRVVSPASHAMAIVRKLRDRAARGDLRAATVRVEPEVAQRLRSDKRAALEELERRAQIRIVIEPDAARMPGQEELAFEVDSNAIVTPWAEPNFGPAPRSEDFAAGALADDDLESDRADYADDDADNDDAASSAAADEIEEDDMDRAEPEGRDSNPTHRHHGRAGQTGATRDGQGREQRELVPASGGRRVQSAASVLRDLDFPLDDLNLPTFEILEPLHQRSNKAGEYNAPHRAPNTRQAPSEGQKAATDERRGQRPRRTADTKRPPAAGARSSEPGRGRQPQHSRGPGRAPTAAARSNAAPQPRTVATPTHAAPPAAASKKPSLLRRLLDWGRDKAT